MSISFGKMIFSWPIPNARLILAKTGHRHFGPTTRRRPPRPLLLNDPSQRRVRLRAMIRSLARLFFNWPPRRLESRHYLANPNFEIFSLGRKKDCIGNKTAPTQKMKKLQKI
jgi:hypothetical protein